MPDKRDRTTESGQGISALILLHSIVETPDSLEDGLRLLSMERVYDRDACVAWGLDREDRAVVLYVGAGTVRARDVTDTLARRTLPRSPAGAGRLVVLGQRLDDELAEGDTVIADEWVAELWTWSADGAAAEVQLERLPSTAGGEGEADREAERVLLSDDEIRSLVGGVGGGP